MDEFNDNVHSKYADIFEIVNSATIFDERDMMSLHIISFMTILFEEYVVPAFIQSIRRITKVFFFPFYLGVLSTF